MTGLRERKEDSLLSCISTVVSPLQVREFWMKSVKEEKRSLSTNTSAEGIQSARTVVISSGKHTNSFTLFQTLQTIKSRCKITKQGICKLSYVLNLNLSILAIHFFQEEKKKKQVARFPFSSLNFWLRFKTGSSTSNLNKSVFSSS